MAAADCDCGMTESMTFDELMVIASRGTCTSSEHFKRVKGYPKPNGGWVCPNFLKEYDRAVRDKRSLDYRRKKSVETGNSSSERSFGAGKTKKRKAGVISKGSLDALL